MPDADKTLPETIPSTQPGVTSTSCGLLMNELVCSPQQLVHSIQDMLDKALDFDTGNYHSPSSPAILYVLRLAVRVEEYMSAVVCCLRARKVGNAGSAAGSHSGCIESCASLLGHAPAGLEQTLQDARTKVVTVLRTRAYSILEQWRGKLIKEGFLSEACEVLAHMAFLFRNAESQADAGGGMDELAVKTLVACQVFLTHNFAFDLEASQSESKKTSSESDRMERIEFYFALAQKHRLRTLEWVECCPAGSPGVVLEDVITVLTSKAKLGVRKAREEPRHWASLSLSGCRGRLCPDTEFGDFQKAMDAAGNEHDDFETWLQVVTTAAVGTEVNVQLGTFTLQSNQTELLDSRFIEAVEFEMALGVKESQRLQCAKVLKTDQCEHVKLMFRHDLHFWEADLRRPTVAFSRPCMALPSWISDGLKRLPAMFQSSSIRLESVSEDFVRGQFMVDTLLMEMTIFKTFGGSHVNIFKVVSCGRRFFRCLVFSSSAFFCLQDLTPTLEFLDGNIFEVCGGQTNLDHLDAADSSFGAGLVVKRHLAAEIGEQVFVPRQYLEGILPSGLLGKQSYSDSLSRFYPVGSQCRNHLLSSIPQAYWLLDEACNVY